MATATASALQEKVETARRLQWELTRCQKELEAVRASILARGEPEDIRRRFRSCQSAMMMCGRLLLLDRRFQSRLSDDKRTAALEMLKCGAKPIELERKLGLSSATAYRLRCRDLNDNRDLRKLRKLTDEQVEEIRSAPGAVTRRVFSDKFGVSMSLISRVRNGRGVYGQVTKVLPIQPSQETAIAKPSGPPKRNELSLRLSSELARSLAEMAQLAGEDVQAYLVSLIESQIADWRSRRIPADFLIKPDNTPAPVIQEQATLHLARMSAQDEDRILATWREGTKVDALATCWSRGSSTIRRALARAKKREKRALPGAEVVQKIIFLSAKQYDENEEHINIRAIAERCNVSEAVVHAVLENHQPLTPASSNHHARPPRPGGWGRHMAYRRKME